MLIAMKPFHKRVHHKKSSKVTLKTHRKQRHLGLQGTLNEIIDEAGDVRREQIKIHQHY